MEQVAEGVFIETGYQGVNVGAVLTSQGVISVDTPSYPRQARDWATRLHRLNHHAVQFLILTDYHGDRIINTRWLNAPIITHQETAERINSYDKRFPQSLLDSLAARNGDSSRELNGIPVERPALTFTHNLSLLRNGRSLELIAAPGPTIGNIWVYLPEQKLLFAGDTITTHGPVLLAEGSCQQWLQTLARLQSWPEEKLQKIVPGRGPLADRTAIQTMSDYLRQLWDTLTAHVTAKRPKEETAVYIPQFLPLFPHHGLPTDWVMRQIKLSLDHVYDEVQLTVR